VTAMACEARATGEAGTPANAAEDNATATRSPARYLWALRLARLDAVFPRLCPARGAPLRIIAFLTETPAIRQILDHTTKAFPGDRRFLHAQTVRIPAAPVAPAVRDAPACWALSSHRTSVRWQIPPSGALWN